MTSDFALVFQGFQKIQKFFFSRWFKPSYVPEFLLKKYHRECVRVAFISFMWIFEKYYSFLNVFVVPMQLRKDMFCIVTSTENSLQDSQVQNSSFLNCIRSVQGLRKDEYFFQYAKKRGLRDSNAQPTTLFRWKKLENIQTFESSWKFQFLVILRFHHDPLQLSLTSKSWHKSKIRTLERTERKKVMGI